MASRKQKQGYAVPRMMFSSFLDEPSPYYEPHSPPPQSLMSGTSSKSSLSSTSRTWKKSILEPRPSFSKETLGNQTRWGGFLPKKGRSWGSELRKGKKPRPPSRIVQTTKRDYGGVNENVRTGFRQGLAGNVMSFAGQYEPRRVIVRFGDLEVPMYYCDSAFKELKEREEERKLLLSGELDPEGNGAGDELRPTPDPQSSGAL